MARIYSNNTWIEVSDSVGTVITNSDQNEILSLKMGSDSNETVNVILGSEDYACTWGITETGEFPEWIDGDYDNIIINNNSTRATLKITTTSSNESDVRTGLIGLNNSENGNFLIQVTQEPLTKIGRIEPEIKSDPYIISQTGETLQFILISNWYGAEWSVNTEQSSWIECQIEDASGEQGLTINVKKNNANAIRNGYVTISNNNNQTFVMHIRQAAKGWAYEVDPDSLEYSYGGGKQSVKITCQGYAEFESYAFDENDEKEVDWCNNITYEYETRDNDKTIVNATVSIDPLNTVAPRRAIIHFENVNDNSIGEDKEEIPSVTLLQNGLIPETSISQENISIGKLSGSTAKIILRANYKCEWSIERITESDKVTKANWLDYTIDNNRSDEATLIFTTTEDNGTKERSAYVEIINDAEKSYTVIVTQKATDKVSEIKPENTLQCSSGGGIFDYYILESNWDAQWNIESLPSGGWVKAEISNLISSNPYQRKLIITIEENENADYRNGNIVINNEEYNHSIMVTQGGVGAKYNVTPNPLLFESDGGVKTVTITSNDDDASFNVNSKPTWCSVSFVGTGRSVQAKITAQPNTSRYRDGSIIFSPKSDNRILVALNVQQNSGNSGGGDSDTGITATYNITHDGYNLNNITYKEGVIPFMATSNLSVNWSWSTSIPNAKVEVVNNNSTNTILNLKYDENKSDKERQFTVTFVGVPNNGQGNYRKAFLIKQQGQAWVKVSETKLTFSDKAETKQIQLESSQKCEWTALNGNWYNISFDNNNTTNTTLNVTSKEYSGNTNQVSTIQLSTIGYPINKTFNISVEQVGVNSYIQPNKKVIDYKDGNFIINCYGKNDDIWTYTNNDEWINKVEIDNQTKKCKVSYNENKGDVRESVITLLRNNKEKHNFVITQNNFPFDERKVLSVDSDLGFSYKSEEKTVQLTSNYNALWFVDTNWPSWVNKVYISKNESQNSEINVTVSENKTTSVRTGNIKVKANNGEEFRINLTQDINAELLNKITYSISNDNLNISPQGGKYSVYLKSSEISNWDEPTKTDTWYDTNLENNGNNIVKLNINAKSNETSEIKEGSIVVKSGNYSHTIKLTQKNVIDTIQRKNDVRLYRSKSDYTIKKKHTLSTQGDIYESDHMTISPFDELFSDQTPIFSSGNFKFAIRNTSNMQRKHSRGNWLKHNGCSTQEDYIWTTECLDYNFITPETRIKLKPNYNSIRDFAYYGSALELIESTINNIIMYFPAELYFSDKKQTITIGGTQKKCYIIDNDFDIDIHTSNLNENDVINPMRYFALNYYNYDLYNNNEYLSGINWSTKEGDEVNCESVENGVVVAITTITINNVNYKLYTYRKGDKYRLLYEQKDTYLKGKSLRPNKKISEEYFNNLGEFEEILLNRNTKPLYRATFETPYETEYGIKTKQVDYVWPSINNWNPILKTSSFEMYYNSLVKVASFHDEHDSDNIWRSMTHEAIKNLDWTFIRNNGDSIEDMSKIDNSKISMLLRLYGRQFDDIKRYIDNIKNINKVSYDEKNNLPDYFLTDVCDLSGWEILNLNITDDNTLRTESLYSGVVNGYTTYDANISFLRRLKLNSNYILSKKGTRSSIDILMRLFGFEENDYNIEEYVYIASGVNNNDTIKYPLAEDVKIINSNRNDGLFNMYNTNPYYKLPVREVTYLHDGKDYSYVIPWYTKGLKYDNNLYFQMNGGWGKQENKNIDLEITSAEEISGDNLYDETKSYLKYAKTLDDMISISNLMLNKNDICYVTDISALFENETYKNSINECSNYFILINENLSSHIGYHEAEDDYGWQNISWLDINNGNGYAAKKVLYLESIIDNTKGNNPHIGNGTYDNGDKYLNGMANIFEYACDNNLFIEYSDEQCEKIKNEYRFILNKIIDNKKSWYFKDTQYEHTINLGGIELPFDLHQINNNHKDISYDINIETFNPEGGEKYDEAAANSVIDVKNMMMTFKLNENYKIEQKEFIKRCVLPYIKQVIPSSTIFEYKFI